MARDRLSLFRDPRTCGWRDDWLRGTVGCADGLGPKGAPRAVPRLCRNGFLLVAHGRTHAHHVAVHRVGAAGTIRTLAKAITPPMTNQPGRQLGAAHPGTLRSAHQLRLSPCEDGRMPSALPDGEPAPPSGELPQYALRTMGSGPFGIYVHVPFCAVRCGYCDFNTYTLTDLGVDGASPGTYADAALCELDFAAGVLGPTAPVAQTVFFGGGTPTMLAASDLVRVLDGIRTQFGLADGAEVTTEANPDSVTSESLQTLAAGGFTRVSIGMQSAVPHVLATLERTHDPANVVKAVEGAKVAGLKVSVDLIYGAPGESPSDWRTS